MQENQSELLPATKKPDGRQIAWLTDRLAGQDWLTAAEILRRTGLPDTEDHRRRLRSLAQASEGAVAGGQGGYKLVLEMTAEEYGHWRNWMSSQADEMKRRVIRADRVWHRRKPVHPGNGILPPPSSPPAAPEPVAGSSTADAGKVPPVMPMATPARSLFNHSADGTGFATPPTPAPQAGFLTVP